MLRLIKSRKGNRKPKTQKQLETSSRNMIKMLLTKNPMHDKDIAKKNMTDKHIIVARLNMQKRNIINNPCNKKGSIERMKNKNPMSNPEIVKRQKLSKLKNKILREVKK